MKTGALRRASALLLLAPLAGSILLARQLPVRMFTMGQGLPRNAVNCLVPGATGMLWVCTSEGLARFDGYQFRLFGPEHGLPDRRITDLVPSRDGGFWVIAESGVCRLKPDAMVGDRCEVLAVDQPAGFFGTLLESRSGQTWVASTRALYRLSADGRRLERTDFEIPRPIISLADGANGGLLVGSDYALYHYRPGQPLRVLSEGMGNIGIQDMLWIDGQLLLATTVGLYRMPAGSTRLEEVSDGHAVVDTLLRRHDGSVWAAASTGLWRLSVAPDGRVTIAERFTERDGLPSDRLVVITEDRQGNLWGSTDAEGIFRIANSGLVYYNERDGIDTPRIASIFEDRLGRLCVMAGADQQPALFVRDGDRFRRAFIRYPFPIHYWGWGWNQLGFQAQNREWWFPTGQGVLRYPPHDRAEDLAQSPIKTVYDGKSALGCDDIFRLFEDSSGDVWVSCWGAGETRLARWDHRTGAFRQWTEADGWLHENDIAVAIRESAPGQFWIADTESVFRFRESRFERFSLREGLPAMVRDLHIDRAGRIWVATVRGGLYRCDNPGDAKPVFRSYTVAEGLSSDSVRSVTEDDAGLIYAGTVRGVDRIDPAAPIEAHRIHHLTFADGLPESENNIAYRDRRGHLWFGSLRGLAEFNPAQTTRAAPPPVYLTRVRVRGQDVPLPWEGASKMSLRLASNRNQIEIEYASVNLQSVASLRYQYRLGGIDSRWSEPVQDRSVNYASLPSGSFGFEVRAVDADGRISHQTAALNLFVEAPVWRRWWFLLGALLLATCIAAAVYNYRVRQLLAIERLRTRIATDLHDDIGASLSQISILSELARRGTAPHLLSDIAETARAMVQDMSDIVWAVNPRHDHFEALAHRMRRFASDTLGGADIDLSFETAGLTADSLAPLEARRPLFLVFKEAVNNTARHSHASRATIRLELTGSALKLTVEDDGRGFDPHRSYDGEGLASIARRMRAAGGTAVWESASGQGTRFTATLPLGRGRSLPELIGWFRRDRG